VGIGTSLSPIPSADQCVCLSVGRSVSWFCRSVCVSVRWVNCGKIAYWIWMLFGVVSWVGRRMGVLDGGGDCPRGRDNFRGEFGASHCNQWRPTLLRSCVKVCEAIKLPFGVVSGVSRGMGALNGVYILEGKGRFWVFSPHWFEWQLLVQLPLHS